MCVESFIYEDSDKYLTLKGFLNQEGKNDKILVTPSRAGSKRRIQNAKLFENHKAEFFTDTNYHLIKLIRLGKLAIVKQYYFIWLSY